MVASPYWSKHALLFFTGCAEQLLAVSHLGTGTEKEPSFVGFILCYWALLNEATAWVSYF